jgi:phage terminase large subunit
VDYTDNPFFPDVLEEERLKLKASDPDAYKHVWEGEFDTRHTGYVYANRLLRAKARITCVPCADGVPVHTVWDLGKSDATSMWFFQVVGFQVRIIDFFEDSNQGLSYYAEHLRTYPYAYGFDYLPHDAGHDRLGMDGSIDRQLVTMGRNPRIIPNYSIEGGIEKARSLINECYFDEVKCKDGLHALNNYRYEWDDNRLMFKDRPLHDWSSHAADAFRYLAFAVDEVRRVGNGPRELRKAKSGLNTVSMFEKVGKKGVGGR